MKKFQSQSKVLLTKALLFLAIIFYGCSEDDPTPANTNLTARIAANSEGVIGDIVNLDGSASQSSNGSDISYNWSFLSKPNGSSSAIIGATKSAAEFTLDKAGTYSVQLEVSNGGNTAIDSLQITNKTPIIASVASQSSVSNLDNIIEENFTVKGGSISISGDFFSRDVTENKVTVNGISYPITRVSKTSITVDVPNNATSGSLLVTVGERTVMGTEIFFIVNLPVANSVEQLVQLEELMRSSNGLTTYFEIGSRFRPLVDGKVIGFSLKMPKNGGYRVTLWDAATQSILVSEVVEFSYSSTDFVLLSDPVALEEDEIYMVTVNANDWYLYIDEQDSQGNIFPVTADNIELISTGFHAGQDQEFPDGFPINYITKGADIIFAADVEE